MSSRVRQRKHMLLLHPPNRVERINIKQERPRTLISETHEDYEYRIYKPEKDEGGYIYPNGETMFMTIEGTPLVAYANEKAELIKCTIREFLEAFWGPAAVQKLPKELSRIFDDKYAAIVTIEPPEYENKETKHIIEQVTAQELLRESNILQLKDLAESEPEKNVAEDWLIKILFLLVGAFGMYFYMGHSGGR